MTRILAAILFLSTAAFAGNTDIIKSPACGAGVIVVQPEPDLLVIGRPVNIFYAQAQARKLLKEMKLREPCENVGRVRSRADLKCYRPERLP